MAIFRAGDGANANNGGTARNAAEISELKQELKTEMARIEALEERIDSVQLAEGGESDAASLRQEIRTEEIRLSAMEKELAVSAGSDAPPQNSPWLRLPFISYRNRAKIRTLQSRMTEKNLRWRVLREIG